MVTAPSLWDREAPRRLPDCARGVGCAGIWQEAARDADGPTFRRLWLWRCNQADCVYAAKVE